MNTNIKIFIYLLIISSFFSLCKKPEKPAETPKNSQVNSVPQDTTPDTIIVKVQNLFPEGITYDNKSSRYLISSLREGVITEVKDDGTSKVFIKDDVLISAIGIHADEFRDKLIVCNSDPGASVKTDKKTQKKVAGLAIFKLSSGEKLAYIELDKLNPKDEHFCNDSTYDDKGNIYVTNSFSPVIYKIDGENKPSIFLQNDRFKGEGFSLNGLVYHREGYLIVAKYNEGVLFKVPIDNPKNFKEIKMETKLVGADGLLWDDKGNLVVVANNGTNKIFLVSGENGWESAKVVKEIPAGDVFPTTATNRKDKMYFLSAKLDKLFGGKLPVDTFEIQKIKF